jgi:quinol monooxygenase YgiN
MVVYTVEKAKICSINYKRNRGNRRNKGLKRIKMIKRIVKMTFREDAVETFREEVFEQSKALIRAFPGCRHMELLQQTGRPNVLCTLSVWDDETALNNYRESELFQNTWTRTKALFAHKAEAWSMVVIDEPGVASTNQ